MTELPLADLPDGEWSFLLVGAWWPEPPDRPTEGIDYWTDHADIKKRTAGHIQNRRTQFGSRNHGDIAADMMERFRADNEVDLFRQVLTDTAARVLLAYSQHAPKDVADWMLLAAIDAPIEGSEEIARYRLAWRQAVGVRHGGLTS